MLVGFTTGQTVIGREVKNLKSHFCWTEAAEYSKFSLIILFQINIFNNLALKNADINTIKAKNNLNDSGLI